MLNEIVKTKVQITLLFTQPILSNLDRLKSSVALKPKQRLASSLRDKIIRDSYEYSKKYKQTNK